MIYCENCNPKTCPEEYSNCSNHPHHELLKGGLVVLPCEKMDVPDMRDLLKTWTDIIDEILIDREIFSLTNRTRRGIRRRMEFRNRDKQVMKAKRFLDYSERELCQKCKKEMN